MTGYVINIEKKTQDNQYFREILYTTSKSQLVVMSLLPGEEIGEEIHEEHDQFLRFEEGEGKVILNEEEYGVSDGFAVVVPAGTKHNVINTGDTNMKLYTIYTPPEHEDGIIHKTKKDAENEHH